MMTRAQFRTIANLGKFTREGDRIKNVQTALHAYHNGPEAQKAQLLRTLKRRCDQWKAHHPQRDQAQLGNRAWHKQVAMNRLIAEIAEESRAYETYRAPLRQFRPKMGRLRFFGDQAGDYRGHHQNRMEVVKVLNNYGVDKLECREWVVGAPPHRGGNPESDDADTAMDMAFRAVRSAREILNKGPFNNRGGLPADILGRERYPRWQDTLVEEQLGELMANANNIVNGQRNIPPQEDFLLQQACLGHLTAHARGGVCSKIASLTLGILTLDADPGTRVAQVYHNLNHEFVMVAYGNSPWIVADPWVHNSYNVPMNRCNFGDEARIVRNMFMIVHRPCRYAFGVDINFQEFNRIREQVRRRLNREYPPDPSFYQMGQDFQQDDNLRAARDSEYPLAADRTQWGPGVFDEEDEEG